MRSVVRLKLISKQKNKAIDLLLKTKFIDGIFEQYINQNLQINVPVQCSQGNIVANTDILAHCSSFPVNPILPQGIQPPWLDDL